MKQHPLAGTSQSKEHIRKRLEARRVNNGGKYFRESFKVWNKGKTKETDERIAKYAIKSVKWKKVNSDGYVGIYVPEHPFNCRGYVMEHRLVMEEKIGRFLEKDEVVHHINEKKYDNRLENLELMTLREHSSHHFAGQKWPHSRGVKIWKSRRESFGLSGGNSPELYKKMWETRRKRYGEKGIKH